MAKPRLPEITSPEPFRVIAEITCARENSLVEIRFYQPRTTQRPRKVHLHTSWPAKPSATVEDAAATLLVQLAHYVRLVSGGH